MTAPAAGLVLVLALALGPTAATAAQASATRLYAPAELGEDFALLRQSLEEGDPGLYRYTPKPILDAVFDNTARQLDRPMTELEFHHLAARAVAAIRNGHTQVELSEPTEELYHHHTALAPLGVTVVAGRAYVVRDFSGGADDLAGTEILAVDDRPMAAILADLRARLSLDGDVTGSRDRDCGGWRLLYDLAESHLEGAPYRVTVSRQGRVERLELTGADGKALVALWRGQYPKDAEVARPAKASLELRRDGIAVITLRHWDYVEDGKAGLSEDFKAWFEQLARQKPKALIIDIRNNGGGDETMSTELLTYLFARPFRYYDCVVLNAAKYAALDHLAANSDPYAEEIPKYEAPATGRCRALAAFEMINRPNLGLQQPREPGYRGPLYVLTNGGSFSTSAEFAAHVKSSGRGALIGQETSGAYYGNVSGMMLPVVLPHTGLRLTDPLIRYDLAVKPGPAAGSGVKPDIAVSYSVAELVSGADKDMAIAVRLAKTRHH